MAGVSHFHKLEALLATLSEVTRVGEIAEVSRLIVRGFVDMGALMAVLLVEDGRVLRVAARWPEGPADELFTRLHGGSFMNFTIPLSNTRNNYVKVLQSGRPLLLDGPSEVADHIVNTYDLETWRHDAVKATLVGAAGAVLPMVAGDRAVGVVGLNHLESLEEADQHLFDIFASSAASLLRFKRDVVSREAILEDLERALAKERETRAELNRSERLAALGEMSAVVAHEIRNPVAVIMNSAATLRKAITAESQASMLCDIIDEETRTIERIIDDMLAFSQPLERGAKHVGVREIIERAIYLLGERSNRAAIDLAVRGSDETLLVAVDARRVSHAMVNLLINARQATSNFGEIAIVINDVEQGGRPHVRIDVRDTGVGIPPNVLGNVFKPFITTKTSGTGLGLSIVKRIIDAHGGQVTIASVEGEGTTVSVFLPVADPE